MSKDVLAKKARWQRPRLGGGTESAASPGGENSNYEGSQLNDFDQRDDGDADPEAELTADVRNETYHVVVRRLGRLDDITVGDVDDDTGQQVAQLCLLQHGRHHCHHHRRRYHHQSSPSINRSINHQSLSPSSWAHNSVRISMFVIFYHPRILYFMCPD